MMCWICDSSSERKFRPSTITRAIDSDSVRISDTNYGQTSALSICRECGFIFADPLPHPNLVDLYREMHDPEYLSSSKARRVQMTKILNIAQRYHPQAKSILDIGAGIGLILEVALERGFTVDGVEPCHWCVDMAKYKSGISLHCGTLEECSDQLDHYDLVTIVDVIEHTDKPLHLLNEAKQRLNPGGLLIVVTIDIGSPTAWIMGKKWWHYRIAHVGYFNQNSMYHALKNCGMEVMADHRAGWQFPATYVCSRLSQYLPITPINDLLKSLSKSQRLSNLEIPLYLGDSRSYVARKENLA